MINVSQVEIKKNSIDAWFWLKQVKLEPFLAIFSANAIILRRENSDNQIKPISITFFYFHQKRRKIHILPANDSKVRSLAKTNPRALLKFIESHYQHQ